MSSAASRGSALAGVIAAALAGVIAAALVVLLACEVWARWVRFGTPALLSPLEYMAPKFRSTDCLRSGPDGEVMWPDCRMHYKGVVLETNALGLNDRRVDETAPHYRIATLGDSLTMAAGIAQRRIYHARVEDRINAELGAPGFVELYNFGRGGRSTGQQLGDLRWALERLRIDAVLVSVVYNDLTDNLLKEEHCGQGDAAHQLSEEERRIHRRMLEGSNRASDGIGLLESWTGLWVWNRLYDLLRDGARRVRSEPGVAAALASMEAKGTRLFRSCAAAIVETSAGADLPRLWLSLWYLPHAHTQLMEAELERLGEPIVPMADVHERFEDPRDWILYPGDLHPSDAVHAVYAERVHEALRAHGWLTRIEAAYRARR